MFHRTEQPTGHRSPPPNLGHVRFAHVLLDVDGTLIDSRAAIVAAYRHAFAQVGVDYPTTDEQIARLLAQRLDEACLEVAGGDATECAGAYRAIYPDVSSALVTPLAGARELLEGLVERGIAISLVTNKGRERLGPDLEHAGLADIPIVAAVTADDSPERKPHPRPILICLDRAGCAPGDAIYVGDGPHDIQAARAAGVAAAAAAYGYYGLPELEAERPDIVIDRPQQLLAFLDSPRSESRTTTTTGGR